MKKIFFLVVCDAEIMFKGTKKACIEYYQSLPNPIIMHLIEVRGVTELRV